MAIALRYAKYPIYGGGDVMLIFRLADIGLWSMLSMGNSKTKMF